MKKTLLTLTLLFLTACQSSSSIEMVEQTYESRCGSYSPDAQQMDYKMISPIVRVAPRFPLEAAKNNVEGFVIMEFDISSKGQPVDIHVTKSYPGTTFVKEATGALKKWRYKPFVKDGQAVTSECHVLNLEFKLG